MQLAEKIGWDLIIGLKQNQRDLYQAAIRLFTRRPADSTHTEKQNGKTYQVQLWDTLQPETTAHEWLWITTLDPHAFPANQVRRRIPLLSLAAERILSGRGFSRF